MGGFNSKAADRTLQGLGQRAVANPSTAHDRSLRAVVPLTQSPNNLVMQQIPGGGGAVSPRVSQCRPRNTYFCFVFLSTQEQAG